MVCGRTEGHRTKGPGQNQNGAAKVALRLKRFMDGRPRANTSQTRTKNFVSFREIEHTMSGSGIDPPDQPVH